MPPRSAHLPLLRLVAEGGNPLQCRVGVNTGEVVVRLVTTGAGHTEYTPIGHTTNLASRMQALAAAGSIAFAENAHRLVEAYVTLKALGPTRVKGVSEPFNVYEVSGLEPQPRRAQSRALRTLKIALADTAGGKWPGRARTAAVALSGAQRRRHCGRSAGRNQGLVRCTTYRPPRLQGDRCGPDGRPHRQMGRVHR